MKILLTALLLGGALICNGAPPEKNWVSLHQDDIEIQSSNNDVREYLREVGSSKGSLHVMNDEPPPGFVTIFLDVTAEVPGKISYWQFLTHGMCKFCLGVFNSKKTADGRNYYVEYAGKNCFQVQAAGQYPFITDIEIPREFRITVDPTSKMAVFYPTEDSPRCLSMESNQRKRMKDNVTPGKLMVIDGDDLPYDIDDGADILPGTILRVEHYRKQLENGLLSEDILGYPSFRAIISAPNDKLSLQYGNASSGVAMYLNNKKWEAICDKWYAINGWPQVLCDELDMPGSRDAFYTRLPLPANITIGMMNPHCKESQNITLTECITREDHPCDYSEIVEVSCMPKVETRYSEKRHQGVPYVYESNYWGVICENRTSEFASDNIYNNDNHWANVFCREHGYQKGAEKLEYASSVTTIDYDVRNRLKLSPITLHNPVCHQDGVEKIEGMQYCRDGPGHCIHPFEPPYITCKVD